MTLQVSENLYHFQPRFEYVGASSSEETSDAPRPGDAKRKVLVVDDEELIAQSVAEILRGEGFETLVASSGAQAVEVAQYACPDIVISDVLMPGIDGVEAAIKIKDLCPDTHILLFSGQASTVDILQRAQERGHEFELLPKPLHPKRLLAAVHRLIC